MRSVIVPLMLVALAAIMVAEPWPFVSPVPPAPPLPVWAFDPTPVRRPTLQPTYRHAGFTYRCGDCHDLIPSPVETFRPLTQHTEIVLKHGINTRCFNCHHRTERNTFADDFGQPIPWNQPQLLCAKCHGPVFRDWTHGSHGRTNGYWDTAAGPQTRRRCIECHDPHQPPFPPMKPAPPPHTLRMGPQDTEHHAHEHNPLRLGPPTNPGVPAQEEHE